MRFVSVHNLKEGMILAKNLYGKNNELLLRSDSVLKDIYINTVKTLGYNGLYINDDISRDIKIKDFVGDNLKIETLKAVKAIYINTPDTNYKSRYERIHALKLIIETLVSDILTNNNIFINTIDLKMSDDYIYFHAVNVTVLSIVIGTALKLTRSDLYKLGLAALLHDIGKVFLPKELLNNKEALTEKEYIEIKKHSLLGYEYLKKMTDIPITVRVAVLEHHERFDGSGYPDNKRSTSINILARIIALADVYDALISERPFRKALYPSEAIKIISRSGPLFDPQLVNILTKKVEAYPAGTCVKLSTGESGIVAENCAEFIDRPKVRLFAHEKSLPVFIDLKNDFNLKIAEILDM